MNSNHTMSLGFKDTWCIKNVETLLIHVKRLSNIEKLINAGDAAKQLNELRNMFKERRPAAKSKQKPAEKPKQYLDVTKWSAGDGGKDVLGQQAVEIYYTLKNTSKKTISIVDGAVVFKDKLGDTMARLSIDRDVDLTPGEEKAFGGRYSNSLSGGLERLLVIDRKHVVVSVDVDKLMYDDGEVISF